MLTGDLREFSTIDLLGLLGRSGVDGALVVDGAASATVHCRGGDVTFATTRLGTTLADVLVSAGFLDAETWAEACRGDDPPAALARALAERGADPARLTQVLQARTEEVVFELGQWHFGTFRFERGADHLLGDAFRFPIPDLLAAVGGRQARWDGLVERFGSLDHVVAPVAVADAASADDELVLNRTQFRLLTAAAGHRSVRGLAEDLDLGLFATGELVAGLVDRGLLATRHPDDAPAPVAVAPVGTAAGGPFAASLAPAAPGLAGHDGAAAEGLVLAGVHAGPNGFANGTGGHDARTDGFANGFGGHDAGTNGFANGFGGHDAGTNGFGVHDGHEGGAGGQRLPQRSGPPVAVAPSGAEFVGPGDAPARDLILRLLTAVKEL